jgi:hypothetical protein
MLGVAESAEDVVIRAAYKALAQKYHPDKNAEGNAASSAAMAAINEAYHVLRDPQRRKEYDQLRSGPPRQRRPDTPQSKPQRERSSTRKTSKRTFPIPDIANWSSAQVQKLQTLLAQELGVPPVFRDQPITIHARGGIFGAKTEVVYCPQMVVIPCGRIGQRLVIPEPFALGRFVVSNDEFLAFCKATGRRKPKDSGRNNRPAVSIGEVDAREYCDWLSSATGSRYRLADKREWEYACRAGTTSETYFGRLPSPKEVNYGTFYKVKADQNPESPIECAKPAFRRSQYSDGVVDVDCYEPNPWGLFQMLGNVHEIVSDVLPNDTCFMSESSWISPAEYLRSDNFCSVDISPWTGFRIARSF